jgi:16S rRNA (cytidine1402-2'-O)-methyltransferase
MNNIAALLPAALAATAAQQWPAPALYIIATPIGNLADISARALAALSMADIVAAEDTRVAQKLISAYGIVPRQLLRCDAHREADAAAPLIAALARGLRVALISDAGTPGISDPGARLVAAVRAAGHTVVPLPGASAVITLLSAAGLADTPFRFIGFAPAKGGELDTWVSELKTSKITTVFFEAPQRAKALLTRLATQLEPSQTVVIGRELTKRFETIKSFAVGQLAAFCALEDEAMQGEWVIAVSAAPAAPIDAAAENDALLHKLLPLLPLKTAVQLAAELSGASKNELYKRALELKKLAGDAADQPTDDE